MFLSFIEKKISSDHVHWRRQGILFGAALILGSSPSHVLIRRILGNAPGMRDDYSCVSLAVAFIVWLGRRDPRIIGKKNH